MMMMMSELEVKAEVQAKAWSEIAAKVRAEAAAKARAEVAAKVRAEAAAKAMAEAAAKARMVAEAKAVTYETKVKMAVEAKTHLEAGMKVRDAKAEIRKQLKELGKRESQFNDVKMKIKNQLDELKSHSAIIEEGEMADKDLDETERRAFIKQTEDLLIKIDDELIVIKAKVEAKRWILEEVLKQCEDIDKTRPRQWQQQVQVQEDDHRQQLVYVAVKQELHRSHEVQLQVDEQPAQRQQHHCQKQKHEALLKQNAQPFFTLEDELPRVGLREKLEQQQPVMSGQQKKQHLHLQQEPWQHSRRKERKEKSNKDDSSINLCICC